MNEFVGKGTENGLNLPDSRFKKIYSINPRTDSVLNSNFKPGSPSKGLVGAGGHKRDSTNIFQLHLILLRYFQCHEERGDGGERLAQYFLSPFPLCAQMIPQKTIQFTRYFICRQLHTMRKLGRIAFGTGK